MIMFCVKCGNQIQDGAAFCSKCGNKVGDVPTDEEYEKLYESLIQKGIYLREILSVYDR